MNNITEKLTSAIQSLLIKNGLSIKSSSELSSERIGDGKIQFNIARQFNTNNFYSCGSSGSIGISRETTTEENAINSLVNAISSFKSQSNEIQFFGLVIPYKGVERSEFFLTEGIAIRYIIDYSHSDDMLIERWDILIK